MNERALREPATLAPLAGEGGAKRRIIAQRIPEIRIAASRDRAIPGRCLFGDRKSRDLSREKVAAAPLLRKTPHAP
jgi:hypothetical protein